MVSDSRRVFRRLMHRCVTGPKSEISRGSRIFLPVVTTKPTRRTPNSSASSACSCSQFWEENVWSLPLRHQIHYPVGQGEPCKMIQCHGKLKTGKWVEIFKTQRCYQNRSRVRPSSSKSHQSSQMIWVQTLSRFPKNFDGKWESLVENGGEKSKRWRWCRVRPSCLNSKIIVYLHQTIINQNCKPP